MCRNLSKSSQHKMTVTKVLPNAPYNIWLILKLLNFSMVVGGCRWENLKK